MRMAIKLAGAFFLSALVGCGSADVEEAEAEVIVEPYSGSTGLDAVSGDTVYPSGPYGVAVGDVLKDDSFFGYKNAEVSESGDLEAFSLGDFYDPSGEKGVELLYISISAVWCPPCQQEAKALPSMIESLAQDGLKVAFFQDLYDGPTPGTSATQRDLEKWLKKYKLPFPVVVDPKGKMNAYFDRNSIPYSIVVDAKTMKILGTDAGFDTRKVKLKDKDGNEVLDENGKPRMIYPLEKLIRDFHP